MLYVGMVFVHVLISLSFFSLCLLPNSVANLWLCPAQTGTEVVFSILCVVVVGGGDGDLTTIVCLFWTDKESRKPRLAHICVCVWVWSVGSNRFAVIHICEVITM